MKTLGKAIANKIASLIVLCLLVLGGKISQEYSFVIKRFSKKSQLLVADADVATTANKKFDSNLTKDWPEWTKTFSDLLVSRKVVMEIPVKTEFKLELEGLDKDDISIENNVLTFKSPLTVYVDFQKMGDSKIKSSNSGVVDMLVDAATGSKKLWSF